MKKFNVIINILLISSLGLSSCKAENLDVNKMKLSEEAFNDRQRKDLIIYMPLENMFPDQKVRSLAQAAGTGDIKKIEQLVADGVDINSRGVKNTTPLFWAIRNNNIEGFDKLLELGADPNIIFAGSSVVHLAAINKNTSFLKNALRHGGNPNLKAGVLNETPLFKTIDVEGYKVTDSMMILLDSGADINAVTYGKLFDKTVGGETPIMRAAGLARFDIVLVLLNRAADYNVKDVNGKTLIDRISSMKNAFKSNSDQQKYLERVVDWLSKKGVYVSAV